MSLAVSILKLLDGQPDGQASLDAVKQYLAVYYSSGPEWLQRMKALAERAPSTINIFGQKLVTREPGAWRVTEAGRTFLAALERPTAAVPGRTLDDLIDRPLASQFPPLAGSNFRTNDRGGRRGKRRRTARERRSA
ncbi:hypothetical protein IVB27_38185 [Bradyrhizobium sp. 197]|nr:hypothetical protein [Bradyrhizobium sp. 197]